MSAPPFDAPTGGDELAAATHGTPLPAPGMGSDSPPAEARAGADREARPSTRTRAPKRSRTDGPRVVPLAEDARPAIVLGPELKQIADRAIGAMRTDLDIYQREGVLVHVVRTRVDRSEDGTFIPAGTPQIRPVAIATLRERLTSVARWMRLDKRSDKLVQVIPPDEVVHAVIARGSWRGIRPLIGIIEAPSMRPDGTLIDKPGYDAETGYLYAPSREFPPVPEHPTQEDARSALAELEDIFVDFPHKTKDHRATAIAAILTLLGRPAVRGNIPAVLWESTTPGTGKGLGADAVGVVGTGRPTAKLNFPEDDVELDKVLAGCALDGTALVNFDNIPTKLAFGGGTLDRCLTSGGRVQLRVLGKSGNPTLPWETMVMATGNNIFIRDDMARRCIMSSLETHLENPEERQDFKHPDLLAWVTAERPRLVCAGLTILRAFIVAGRPRLGIGTWGSFEQWAALIPPAIVFAGGGNPMRTRPTVEARSDPEKDAMRVILRDLPRLDTSGTGITAKTVIGCLYPIERLRGQDTRPDGYDEMRESIEALVPTKPSSAPDTRAFGRILAKFKGRVIGGVHLQPKSADGGVMKWRVVEARRASSEADVEREAIESEGCKLGPNGCAFEDCDCAPCAKCGGCKMLSATGRKARATGRGGCACTGRYGCAFEDCDCRPCTNGHCNRPDRPLDGGGCYC
ncbi:hypothetical protein [Sorangium sp. So ce1000]|uniref:hypothetical protein n=1 Tax=Sorangium sp. So ce1000 TaxID=3133325 RepID=UPI003F63C4A4